jgi:hypothetical protein
MSKIKEAIEALQKAAKGFEIMKPKLPQIDLNAAILGRNKICAQLGLTPADNPEQSIKPTAPPVDNPALEYIRAKKMEKFLTIELSMADEVNKWNQIHCAGFIEMLRDHYFFIQPMTKSKLNEFALKKYRLSIINELGTARTKKLYREKYKKQYEEKYKHLLK